jgi:hypothetical protein
MIMPAPHSGREFSVKVDAAVVAIAERRVSAASSPRGWRVCNARQRKPTLGVHAAHGRTIFF